MPLTLNLNLNQSQKASAGSVLSLNDSGVTQGTIVLQSDTVVESIGPLIQSDSVVLASAALYQKQLYSIYTSSLNQFYEYLDNLVTINNAESLVETLGILNQVEGTHEVWLNPRRFLAYLRQNDAYQALYAQAILETHQKARVQYTPLQTVTSSLSSGVGLLQEDVYGPRPMFISPASGSSFNSPLSPIQFNYIDAEGSNVNVASIYVAVNDVLLISGGVNITPPGYGTTILTPITTQNYLFQFIPDAPFSDTSPVSVSGQALDTHIPANSGSFYYTYEVWSTSDIIGSIVGLADADSPYLQNLNPAPGQVEVSPTSSIYLEVTDDHTGINTQSVSIDIDGIPVISGGVLVDLSYGTVVMSSIKGGRGKSYLLTPYTEMEFSHPTSVRVYAEDLYTPAVNVLDQTYSFLTIANSHLTASGLQLYSDGMWEQCDTGVGYTTTTTTGTLFRVTYTNALGTGINTLNSKVLLNNTQIYSTIVEQTPGTDYLVEFSLPVDYTTNSELNFYVEQVPLVSGNTVFNNYYTDLLWGAEYCYTPSEGLSYASTVPVVVQACNLADRTLQGALIYEFSTVPMPTLGLGGQIYPTTPPSDYLVGLLESNNPFFEYNKLLNFELEAKDFAGNTLTYKWTLKIEPKP